MPEVDVPLFAAAVFTGLTCYLVVFQAAVALGAPLGRYTLGGRWSGPLPAAMRPLAVVQGAMAVAMAAAVLDRSGWINLGWPAWTFWAAIGVCALSVLANAATPSRPERRLGLPVASLMLLSALAVGWG